MHKGTYANKFTKLLNSFVNYHKLEISWGFIVSCVLDTAVEYHAVVKIKETDP